MADGPMPGGAGGGEMGAGEDAATPGAGGVAAAVAVAPAPAIVKKVKKVVETRLDAPELAVALQQLSEFYGASGAGRAGQRDDTGRACGWRAAPSPVARACVPSGSARLTPPRRVHPPRRWAGQNTLENRRNLRSTIERRSVDVNKKFVGCFADVMAKLERVEGHVDRLADCSQRMRQRLQAAQATTSQVLKITEQLQKKEVTAEAHKDVVQAFLARFRLQPNEMAVLNSGEISDEFLAVLSRVAEIQVSSKKLLRVHHKTALMDIVDEAGALQEAAYNRLYKWLQDKFARVHSDATDIAPLMKSGAPRP
jgi:hypothetical protein